MRIALLTVIAACASAAHATDIDLDKPPPQVAAHQPASLGGTKSELVVQFTNWSSALAVTDLVGELRKGLFCSDPSKLHYTKKLDEWFYGNLGRNLKDRTVKLGFSAPEHTKSVFDDKPGAGNNADLRLGATLLAFDYRTCGDATVKGSAYAKIKWEVFSVRQQRVVYSATSESSLSREDRVPGADFTRAFMESVIDGLLSDAKFAELVRTGNTGALPEVALAPLKMDIGQVVEGGVAKSAPGLLEAVVTVETGVGSGSAFYISQEGYLLTNQHVVADARFVRVKLPDGHSLVGEVLRVDRPRDVALLRTDPVTRGVLALRSGAARVGEEVYAVGSPFGEVLSGTLTRGVLSQRRVVEGVAYLQSDVAINPGSSGGPLIDAEGHVLGITQLAGTKAQGINLFIPIEDALDKLGLVLTAGAAVPK